MLEYHLTRVIKQHLQATPVRHSICFWRAHPKITKKGRFMGIPARDIDTNLPLWRKKSDLLQNPHNSILAYVIAILFGCICETFGGGQDLVVCLPLIVLHEIRINTQKSRISKVATHNCIYIPTLPKDIQIIST